MDSDRDILNALRDEAEEACRLFSNAGQPLQERIIVVGFLRALGQPFEKGELIKLGPEPVDVHFQDARFQVTQALEKGRRPNAEVQEAAGRRHEARSLGDLAEEEVISSRPDTPQEVYALVRDAAAKKHRKYGQSCTRVDLLVHVELRRRHLYPTEPWPRPIELEAMG